MISHGEIIDDKFSISLRDRGTASKTPPAQFRSPTASTAWDLAAEPALKKAENVGIVRKTRCRAISEENIAPVKLQACAARKRKNSETSGRCCCRSTHRRRKGNSCSRCRRPCRVRARCHPRAHNDRIGRSTSQRPQGGGRWTHTFPRCVRSLVSAVRRFTIMFGQTAS